MTPKFFLVTNSSPVYKDDAIAYFNVTLNEINNDKSLVDNGEEFTTAVFNNDTGDSLLFFGLMKNLISLDDCKSPIVVNGYIAIIPACDMTPHVANNCIISKK